MFVRKKCADHIASVATIVGWNCAEYIMYVNDNDPIDQARAQQIRDDYYEGLQAGVENEAA